MDWGYAIGEALGGMTAKVYYSNGRYHMDLKYYLIDTYEFLYHWTEEDHDDFINKYFHELHEARTAKEYKIIGCYQESFEWKKDNKIYEAYYNPKIRIDKDKLNANPLY